MLRAANLTARAVVLILVGVFTFKAPWPGTADGAAEIAVFAVAASLRAGFPLKRRPGRRGEASARRADFRVPRHEARYEVTRRNLIPESAQSELIGPQAGYHRTF
jgi:hypothetical protein